MGETGGWAARPTIIAPLLLAAMLLPLFIALALGHLRPRTLALWAIATLLVLVGLALHEVTRVADAAAAAGWWLGAGVPRFPSPALVFFAASGCFIG